MTDRRLHVVAVISNPVRYASRERLFREFMARMEATPGVVLTVVEQAFGDRPFRLTDLNNRNHVQVRAGSESEVWVKESLVNIGFRHVSGQHPDWKYGAWIDGDIKFLDDNWASETVEALQHYRIVQPWARQFDMDPCGHPIGHAASFGYSYITRPLPTGVLTGSRPEFGKYTGYMLDGVYWFHPGYAWAIRRETLEQIGGLIDWLPMGSGDHHMAWAFIGRDATPNYATAGYRKRMAEYVKTCAKYVKRDVGYVNGTIAHYWHGSKRNRFYVERRHTLRRLGFDPDKHVRKNSQGLLVVADGHPEFRDALRQYFRSRNEDSIDA